MAAACVRSTREFFTTSITAFVTDPKNRPAKFLKSYEGQDKLAKFASDGIFPLVTEVSRMAGASDRTMENLATGQQVVKITRDITGLPSLFRGIIPGLVSGYKGMVNLVHGFWHNREVVVGGADREKIDNPQRFDAIWDVPGQNGSERQQLFLAAPQNPLPATYTLQVTGLRSHNKIAAGRTEIALKLGEQVGGLIGGATFAAGMGVCRPLLNVRKLFDVQYSKTANQMCDVFPYIMAVNHIGVAFQRSCDIAFQCKAYERAMGRMPIDPARVNKDFTDAVVKSTLSLVEKTLEMCIDGCLFIGQPAPIWIKIPFGFAISSLSLVRAWRETV